MLKVVGDKYGIDKVKRVQDWVTWTVGRWDPFPLNGSLDPKVQDGGEKTPAGIAKRIYPVLDKKTETEGADIQQCSMMQTGENEWVWRSWTPQDVRRLKANKKKHLKGKHK